MPTTSIELFFIRTKSGITLDHVRFQPREGQTAVESVRGDRFRRVGPSFAWTRSLRALSLLLVRHGVGEEPSALVGGPKSPVRTLFNLLEHPERGSAATPFTSPDGTCHLPRLLTCTPVGHNRSSQPEHSVAIEPNRLPPSAVGVFLDAHRLSHRDEAQELLRSLASAWPRWHQPATSLPPPAVEPQNSRAAHARRATETERNHKIAAYYANALAACPLQAASRALTDLLPGEIHLAFNTSPNGAIDFATSQGQAGREFCTATMGAASSNPLLGQCHGQVRAISDVLPTRAWRNRALYHCARQHLSMEDAIGTDFLLANGTMFTACVIRDTRSFPDEDRRAFELLLPHFRNILSFSTPGPNVPPKRNGNPENCLHVFDLPHFDRGGELDAQKIRHLLHAHLPATEAADLAPAILDWVQGNRQRNQKAFSPTAIRTRPSLPPAVVCIPATKHSAGAIVFPLPATAQDPSG